ncbi:MAG: biotin/lipoyl-binding protein [Clostridia bacterium]|nr:biotin/lipoyl-binding protein [Clostridia bacterium]
MKAYKVTVNGNVYEITLEVIDKADIKAAPAPAPTAPAAPAAPAAAGATTVSAPMPGNILKVNVTAGQAVKKGDVLMILEAMKMENEIMSPVDGTVASVGVNAGATVESGAVLCTLN